ncbi:hypothetical protein HTZ84_18575 [Haloterrigena sp. SYSU A558-1]|uniref:Uncharacterized protein n=4 Tax=Haloterrigena TaxID=121871 RepID=M0CF94_9EURY|nr:MULTISPECIES: hypothetical protein [Haloterrigena]ELZ21012.1 hypothetical protein C477_05922 [Haloterrigena salina JCM 13891]NUB89898.1 hypothetical protein [Haloterrigena gelatinilytica]NUC74276.1 hypothetical protein [Haloterrigena gelatinilytica]QRV13387.1 hypothetical protein JMJ58_10415 [Haloterrigena salifodinae]
MTDAAECKPETIEPEQDDEERDDAHLDDIEEGAGCTEIWEHLAEKRDE